MAYRQETVAYNAVHTMPYTQETVAAQEVYHCYHCGLDSADSSFKYFDNKKTDQPRHKCNHCHKLFTVGLHGRPRGKTYAKKRNEDPDVLKSLSRQCRHCGVADNALFKYYNNNNLSQPRFKCLSCGKQFQMRLMGTGEERRLVHTSAAQARAPRRQKQGVPEPLSNASDGFVNGSYQPYDDAFMPVPSDLQAFLQPAADWFADIVMAEDVQYPNIPGVEWAQPGENCGANFTSLPSHGEDAEFGDFLEEELLAQENIEGSNDDALSCSADVANALQPQTWSNEESQLMNFAGAGESYNEAPCADMVSDNMGEMVSESPPNKTEVMYGTLEVENPTSSSHEPWTRTHNNLPVNPNNASYADDATACCRQMDLETPSENSNLEQIDTRQMDLDTPVIENSNLEQIDAHEMDLDETPIEDSEQQIDTRQMDLDRPVIENGKEEIDTFVVEPCKTNYLQAARACSSRVSAAELAGLRNANPIADYPASVFDYPDSPWGMETTSPWIF